MKGNPNYARVNLASLLKAIQANRRRRIEREDVQLIERALRWDKRAKPPHRRRFVRLKRLGRGGQGVVYKCRDLSMGRVVAVKFLRPSLHDRELPDGRCEQQFIEGAQGMGQVHATNVVPVYSRGTLRGIQFYVMQYVEGHAPVESLFQEFLKTRPAAARNGFKRRSLASYYRFAAEKLAEAAEAVGRIHEQGRQHNDLTPRNLLLAKHANLRVYVIDFGLWGDSSVLQTAAIGKLYTPPPAYADAGNGRSDLWILSRTLMTPFFRGVVCRFDVHRQDAVEDKAPPSLIHDAGFCRRLRVPASLVRILRKGTHDDPHFAYQNAQELAEDLRSFASKMTPKHAPSSLISVRRLEPLALWIRRRPAWATAIMTCLFLAGLVLRYYLKAGDQKRRGDIADAELIASKEASHYSSLVDEARRGRDTLSAGWTQTAISNLSDAVRIKHRPQDDAALSALRDLTAAATSAIDIDPKPLWSKDFRGSSVAFLNDKQIAIGQTRDWGLPRPTVQFFDAQSGDANQTREVPGLSMLEGTQLRQISEVAASPDGRWLIGIERHGRVHRWDLNGDDTTPLTESTDRGAAPRLAISPDGRFFVTWNAAGDLHTWSMEPFQALAKWTPNYPGHISPPHITSVLFSADASRLAICSDKGIVNLDTATLQHEHGRDETLRDVVAGSADHETLLFGPALHVSRPSLPRTEPLVRAAPLHGGRIPKLLLNPYERCAALSQNGQLFVVFDKPTNSLCGFRTTDFRHCFRLPVDDADAEVKFAISPNAQLLAVVTEVRVAVHRILQPTVRTIAAQASLDTCAVLPSQDGTRLWTVVERDPGPSADLLLEWNLSSNAPAPAREFQIDSKDWPARINHWAISPDERWLATLITGADINESQIVLHRLDDGRPERMLPIPNLGGHQQFSRHISGLQFGPNHQLYAAAESRILKWDLNQPAPDAEILDSPESTFNELVGTNFRLNALAVGSRWCIAGSDVCAPLAEPIVAFGLYPLGGPPTMTARLFSARHDLTALRWTPDEQHVVAGFSSGRLALISVPDIKLAFDLPTAHADRVTSMTWCGPDLLATGSEDGSIRLWTVREGRIDFQVQLPAEGTVTSLRQIPGTLRLVAAVAGHTGVQIWDLDKLFDAYRQVGIPGKAGAAR